MCTPLPTLLSHTHKHWGPCRKGKGLSSGLQKEHRASHSTEAVFCYAASNLNVSIICPYKNTALSSFSTRDYICNQGNKIQVQQPHHHRCFCEHRDSTERVKASRGSETPCEPLSIRDACPSCRGSIHICFTTKNDHLSAGMFFYLIVKALCYLVSLAIKKWSFSETNSVNPLAALLKSKCPCIVSWAGSSEVNLIAPNTQ